MADIEDNIELPAGQIFTETLEAALNDAFPSDDPLDNSNFKALEFINTTFPNGMTFVGKKQSLTNLEEFMTRLSLAKKRLDEQILENVRVQGAASDRGRQDLKKAKEAIAELSLRIRQILERAGAAESMVEELCRDVRTLDFAKRNLEATVRALQMLQNLIVTVNDIRRCTETRQYDTAEQLVKGIEDLVSWLKPYSDIPKVAEVQETVVRTRAALKAQVFSDLEDFVDDTTAGGTGAKAVLVTPELASECCLVAEALGDDVRSELIEWFLKKPVRDYQKNFPSTDQLELVDQRCMWIQLKMTEFSNRFMNVIPKHWDIYACLAMRFCEATRERLVTLLDTAGDSVNVTVLVRLMKNTQKLENYLNNQFPGEMPPEEEKKDIRSKYSGEPQPFVRGGESKKEVAPAPVVNPLQVVGNPQQKPNKRFTGTVSTAFERAMTVYVKHEEAQLMNVVARLLAEEDWKSEDRVSPSATDLLSIIKRYLEVCTDITKRQPLYDFSRAFAASLVRYATDIEARLDKDKFNEQQVMLMIRTLDFCVDTTNDLCESVRTAIDSAFREHITFDTATEAFKNTQGRAIVYLVSIVENKVDQHMHQMHKTNWSEYHPADAMAEDDRDYMKQLCQTLRQTAIMCGRGLSKNFFGFFNDKVSAMVISRFANGGLFKLKNLTSEAVQKLQMDIQTELKPCLLELPTLSVDQVPPRRMYAKLVETELGRFEAMLKLVGMPSDELCSQFMLHLPTGTEIELYKVMEFRGMKKQEKEYIIREFRETGGSNPDREEDHPQPARTGAQQPPKPSTSARAIGNEIGKEIEKKVQGAFNDVRGLVDRFRS